jgi:hypothetical protein
MSYTIPTYDELVDAYITNYETALGQDAPLTPKAFLRVLARVQALTVLGLYKLAAERTQQNYATTATGDDLKRIGAENGVTYQAATAAELVLTCTGTNGVDIPADTVFIGDSNNLRYYTQSLVTIAAGTAAPTVTCYTAGVDGNLVATDGLTLSSPISGIDNAAVVASVSVTAVDNEDEEDYRRQVLDAIQTTGGGSNLADYREWAQETPSIVRAFPYSGAPTTNRLDDGDMEDTGTTAWSGYGSPTITKQTGTPYEGTRCLRVARGASASPYAYQNIMLLNNSYNITGVARGDGTCNPILKAGNVTLWTGTSSTSWQAFDVDFDFTSTTNTRFQLYTNGGAATNYVEWDDLLLTVDEVPGHVTVYAECDESVEADGIPDSTLLGDVRDYITTDQVTGIVRPALGAIDNNLFVEPIIRTSIYIEIRGLEVATEYETACKADLDTDLDDYLREATPYIAGLDTASSQADQITDPLLSRVVQDVLASYGASCSGIGIGTAPGVFLASYSLGAGELAKLGAIAYV